MYQVTTAILVNTMILISYSRFRLNLCTLTGSNMFVNTGSGAFQVKRVSFSAIY